MSRGAWHCHIDDSQCIWNTRVFSQVIAGPVAITAERNRLNASTQLRGTYYAGAALFAHRPQSEPEEAKSVAH
uniref:Uncharacterized protein n=1 Tax=Timema genevievae TaxID=629358 RepID=A0A7R9K6D3_TIMGE|nr:unnamed protein product [Timema genevievae]